MSGIAKRGAVRKARLTKLAVDYALRASKSMLAGLMITGFFSTGAAQADDLYRTEYEISIFGLSLARSAIETTVKGAAYSVNGRFMTSGIARIFDDTDGTVHVGGRSVAGKVMPSRFDLAYKHGRKSKSTKIRFANGNVMSAENMPPVKKRNPWVETTPGDLLDVSDPISVMMIPAKNLRSVCDRTLNIFDGQTRADIKLSFNGTQAFTTRGFTGETVICSAKFVPIAGYQKGKKAINYLSKRSKITISFATLGNSGIYAPVVAHIGTQLGTLKIQATRFEKMR